MPHIPAPAIIFLKAIIPGGAAADLFSAPVMVGAHVRKDGTFIAPHASHRLKRRPEAPLLVRPAQADIFAPRHPAAARPPAPPPAQASLDLAPAVAPAPKSTPVAPPPKPVEAPPPAPEAPAAPPPPPPPAKEPPAPAPEAPGIHRPAQWGLGAGAKAAARVKANRAAEAILRKADADMTPADLDALARYTGWGGCGTSPNEYFTPPEVAAAMWSLVGKLGFAGGTVLEPSAGTGVFHQTAPDGAKMVGVELSTASARINRLLHGARGDEVHQSTLEAFATADQRKFDLVIGNPPFGGRDAFRYDDLTPGKSALARAEHYFLDTALDKAADGALVAFIVPNGVMDNPTARDFRARLLAKGQMVAAFRLPNTAFADSQTSVTTDILVFRKRPQAIAGALAALTERQQAALPHWNEDFVAGRYMTDGAGAAEVLGTTEDGWRAKLGLGNDITVTGSMDGVAQHIADWVPPAASLADDSPAMPAILDAADDGLVKGDEKARARIIRASEREPYPRLREGTQRVVDGVLYVLRDSRWHRAEEAEPEAVAAARRVGALLEPVVDGTAPDMPLARAKLIEALDEFNRQHGHPAKNRTLAEWTSEPRLPLGSGDPAGHAQHVQREARRVSLLMGAVREDGSYSDAVTGAADRATRAPVEVTGAALASAEGSFTPEALAAAQGMTAGDALDFLHASPAFALLPDGRWTSTELYHAGEMWPKLDAAMAAAKDLGRPQEERDRFARQAEGLRAAIAPMDLADVENIALDSPFVTHECIAAWLNDTTQGSGRWQVTERDGIYTVQRGGGYGRASDDLLERMLMRRGVRKDELAEVEEKNGAFREWLLGNPEWKGRIEEQYNRTFRGFAPRTYSQEPMVVPGLSPDFDVHGFQWAGVRWAMDRGKGIIAADVGVGKTPRALILNQLLRSTGRAKKPIIVMPKSLLSNWNAMIGAMFPDAKVLTIGETLTTGKDGKAVSREDDEATRRAKLARLKQDDHDFVLMTLPAWNMTNLSDDRHAEYEGDEFFNRRRAALDAAAEAQAEWKNRGKGKTKAQIKAEERRAAKDEAEKKRRRFRNAGEQNITFEDLGVDAVIMDEAHSMKNLATPEAGLFRDLKFLGAPGEASKQAAQSQHKFRYIREKNDGRNVFLLTATPTKNSPLEIYSMMQHVAPEVWEGMGVRNADDFISRFVEQQTETILNTQMQAEDATIVSGFRNLNEVRQAAQRYIHRTTAAEVGLKLPKPEVLTHAVDMDEKQAEAYAALRPLLDEALKGRNKEGTDHPFSVMSDMAKVATDMDLHEPGAGHPPSPKLRAVADACAQGAREGGQVVFADYIGSHARIRDLLVARGMDPRRIAIVNAQATPSSAARQKIADRFNAGELDVVIGNTPVMGEGLNLQKRTTDIHHVDIPWEPASMIQRNGRGLRQGNRNQAIRLHSYLTRGSFDGYRWQSMMAKSDWQTAFWGGGNTAENMQRGGMGRLEMLIAASADPDAARAKFADALEQAKEDQRAQKEVAANKLWGRYREAKRQMESMAAKRIQAHRWTAEGYRTDPPPPGETEAAQEKRVAALRTRLLAEEAWPHREAIDAPQVVVDRQTGRIWKPGDEVEFAAGSRATAYSPEPEPFDVVAVDEVRNRVRLRHAGLPGTEGTWHDVAKLREGVSATKVDRQAAIRRMEAQRAAADQARQEAQEAQRRAAAEGERRKSAEKVEKMLAGGDDYAQPHDLAAMGDDFLERHAEKLRARMREGIAGYKLHSYGGYAVEAPDGTITRKDSNRHMENGIKPTDVLALPTQANREKLVQAAVDDALTHPLANDMKDDTGRRGAYRGRIYAGARRVRHGSEKAYGDSQMSPAHQAHRVLFPEADRTAFQSEVARRIAEAVVPKVDAAPTFRDALHEAARGFTPIVSSYGGTMSFHDLPLPVRHALLRAAHRTGSDQTMWRNLSPRGQAGGTEPAVAAHTVLAHVGRNEHARDHLTADALLRTVSGLNTDAPIPGLAQAKEAA